MNAASIIATVILGSGFTSGVFALITKKLSSPETKNDLARLGNEFAHQMLTDARIEREELRLSIQQLEEIVSSKNEAIERLKTLLRQKDNKISALERGQITLANKLQQGLAITLKDIFGDKASDEFLTEVEDTA